VATDAINKIFSKKRRSAEPASNPSGSNHGSFDPVLPNLNDDNIPTPRSRRRDKENDSSSKSGLTDSVASYTSKKTQILLEKEERRKKKDEEQLVYSRNKKN
jgi:hypothetical protein